RLDEAIRLVDEIPLLNQAPSSGIATPEEAPPPSARAKANTPVTRASQPTTPDADDDHVKQAGHRLLNWTKGLIDDVWAQTKSLVRVTRINRPEGMLIAPEQSFFLRENLKLRLLNARLALLSRQSATAINDIETAQTALNRYFDTSSRKSQLLQSMLKEVANQSPQTVIPRPDDTLAALAAITGSSR
ncbi:MAG TPA: uroporphyrinogen-III C-methyltransferase, partial [Aquabacterium sp.]|nr:uroporphyrinogen-III C-methyltransferase [Aquabacterium sp.]